MTPSTALPARDADPDATRGRAPFLVFAALVCALGLVYSVVLLGGGLRYPDEADYLALARHLAALDGYTFDGVTPTAQRPPGYPVVLAPLVALADSVHAVRLSQFAMLALAAHLLAGLVSAGAGVARWQRSSLLLALTFAYPVLFYTAGTLFPQTLLALAFAVVLVLLHRRGDSLAIAAGIGALAAFSVEISPTVLVLLPAVLAFALLSARWSGSRALVMALAMSLVLGGWLARNVVVMGEPILFSTNLAENLDNAVLNLEPLAPGEERPPAGAIDYGLERLGQYLADPGIYLRRVVDFFASRNEMHVAAESSSTRDLVMFLTYNALLLAVLARLALIRRRPLSAAEWWVLGLYLGTALFHALVIPRIRYRLPFDFLLMLPALNALLYALAAGRRARRPGGHLRRGAD